MRVIISYDMKCGHRTVLKNLVECPPEHWTENEIISYIQNYLSRNKNIVNITTDNENINRKLDRLLESSRQDVSGLSDIFE